MRIPAVAPPVIAEDLANIPSPRALSALVERLTPLKVHEHHETARIRITPPAGYAVVSEPNAVSERGPLHALDQTATISGGVLVIARSIQFQVGRVDPANYPTFRKSLDAASRIFAEGASLTKKNSAN